MRLHDGMNRRQAYTLYINHALSTWNARSYEFAAVLFTASAYPDGLRAASLIGVSTSLAAICFGSAIGRWIDHGTSRLRTLLTTITINRFAIVAACLLWFFIVGGQPRFEPVTQSDGKSSGSTAILHDTMKTVTFSLLLLLGIIESLSRKANVISIERDWVPILAPVTTPGGYTLTHVNAMMVRVDMICKLIAPIAISWFLSVVSTRAGVVVVALINGVGFTAELWSAGKL
jgi:iron-regulated transporter 1